jgi:hypothetical protein
MRDSVDGQYVGLSNLDSDQVSDSQDVVGVQNVSAGTAEELEDEESVGRVRDLGLERGEPIFDLFLVLFAALCLYSFLFLFSFYLSS